jgi:hypothetical protein
MSCHGWSTPPGIPGALASYRTAGQGLELHEQQDIKPEDTHKGHGRDALQAHLIPRSDAGTHSDAHEYSGAPRGMPHGRDYGQTQAKELEEQQEEEWEHDGTCLLWSPTAGNIAGGREQNICHLSSIWTYMLESTAQRGNRSAAVSQEGRYRRKHLSMREGDLSWDRLRQYNTGSSNES